MKDEKCCCNCLHCARWQTSKGIKCHCDLIDRYLSYLDVMDTDNDCCRWEKETKWDLEKEHDKEIYNLALDDVLYKLNELLLGDCPKECICCIEQDFCPYDECNKDAIEIVKQLKGE